MKRIWLGQSIAGTTKELQKHYPLAKVVNGRCQINEAGVVLLFSKTKLVSITKL